MKGSTLLALGFLTVGCSSVGPTGKSGGVFIAAAPLVPAAAPYYAQMAPLPMPVDAPDVASVPLEDVVATANALEPTLGTWPPRLRDEEDRQAAYRRWCSAIISAERLRGRGAAPEHLRAPGAVPVEITLLVAALYRQGHNMQVTGAGNRALALVQEGMQAYPDSIPMNWEAAHLLVQIEQRFGGASQVLLNLRRLLATDANPDVERLLVVAYLHEGKVDQAKTQVDRALALNPGNASLLRIKQALDSGAVRYQR